METKELKIEQTNENGTLTCKLTGWLDPNTSPKLVDSIDLNGISTLIFDMENVEYVFSAGLRAFLIFQKFIDLQNGTMRLINVSDDIRSIFECTGFESMLDAK